MYLIILKSNYLLFLGEVSYPDSVMYSSTNKLSPVNFNEGVRTPVLQYAHPELGVQPAKVTAEEDYKDSYNDKSYAFESTRKYYDSGNDINRVDYYR